MSAEAFYDRLAPFYHLIFPDWDASIARQAEQGEISLPIIMTRLPSVSPIVFSIASNSDAWTPILPAVASSTDP